MLLGVNCDNHDASMALVDGDRILWAAHSERYSRIKNDSSLNLQMVEEMLSYGIPKTIVISDRPFLKSSRRLISGERPILSNYKDVLSSIGLGHINYEFVGHHKSHAAAGYFTSKFDDASILVVDSIGEWNTVTIWKASGRDLKKVISYRYPNSIGLFYSSMTQYVGLKPNEDEYILMGMAAYGEPTLVDKMLKTFFDDWNPPRFKAKHNLHRGCQWWEDGRTASQFDIAASAQFIVEYYLTKTAEWMKTHLQSKNLVFMGGVALNCVANSLLAKIYDNVYIMPNPGDAGNSIGACAALLNDKLEWNGPYLGTDIDQELDIDRIVKYLMRGDIVGIANGRAEFGPRALGNRSLLCDPRGQNAKDRMNVIKKRQNFRPFAPAILAEHSSTYFDISDSPYMQFVSKCKDPKSFPGICHVDNTSRVQTVTKENNPRFRELLEAWYNASGCPMLMNTSLNIKGQPLVNSWNDAMTFQNKYSIKIF